MEDTDMTRVRRLSIATPLLLALVSVRSVAQFDVSPDHYHAPSDSAATFGASPSTQPVPQQGRLAVHNRKVNRRARLSDTSASLIAVSKRTDTATRASVNYSQNGACASWNVTTPIICALPKCAAAVSAPLKIKCLASPY
jgi:hypothetical protein